MSKRKGKSKILVLLALLGIVFLGGILVMIHPSVIDAGLTGQVLNSYLEKGEALIWYLGHAGWAVKTKNHFFIFDYVLGYQFRELSQSPSLPDGYIVPIEIKDQSVFVFASHGHGDHFDPAIFEWEKSIENITYVFGWEAGKNPDHVYLKEPRMKKAFDGLEVYTINHEFDGIPEVAYLIKVDDLVIFFSGDHGSTGEDINPVFKDNIDYLSQQAKNIDIAFISMFGSRTGGEVNKGDLYTISKLGPRVALPMHQGRGERFYKKFAQEAKQKGAQTEFLCAEKAGDRFHYVKDGRN